MDASIEHEADLRDCCRRFRDAIERCDRSKLPITFEYFPAGACGDTTPLLGRYLAACGFGWFDYVCGERDEHSHAWLQLDGLIVDITGDQFPDMPHSIFVGRASAWHDAFAPKIEHRADFELYDEAASARLRFAYNTVLDQLKLITASNTSTISDELIQDVGKANAPSD